MKLFITILALSISIFARAQADTFKQDTAAIENNMETAITKTHPHWVLILQLIMPGNLSMLYLINTTSFAIQNSQRHIKVN